MCGILGIASSSSSIDMMDLLKDGGDAMQHRGPDDAGIWVLPNNTVGLAHVRLSIVDLSFSAHQPMLSKGGDYAIVFNGEIYNFPEIKKELIEKGHSFISNSDTEVLLASFQEWGSECLSRINGMFAFAILNIKTNSLFLARDRAGEKPLFYRLHNKQLRFSSELKGLLVDRKIPRKVDRESLDLFLSMGYVPGDKCILQGFNKLPPAHAMTFNLNSGSLNIWRYWSPPDENLSKNECKFELVNELEELLEKAVSRQLCADVPVGLLLSGGVDSSLVTAMAARSGKKIQTYTIGFPGHGNLDETLHARKIANYFGTTHNELVADQATIELLPRLAHQYDEPIIDSSMVPTFLVSSLVRKSCKVALGGDGGDELFGGYHHHSRLLWMKKNLGWIPLFLRSSLGTMAEENLPIGFKGRNYLKGMGSDLQRSLPIITSHFDPLVRKKIINSKEWPINGLAENLMKKRVPKKKDFLRRLTQYDFENYLPEDILVKVDRASMLNSLEVRSPFLDKDIIEFAFSKVPSIYKSNEKDRKILLKLLTEKVLPEDFDKNRKQGFSIPLASWLEKGTFRNFFEDILFSSECIFDRNIVQELFDGLAIGRNNSERLFGLVIFELWRKNYDISL